MEYRKFQDTYVIRMDRGEEVVAALTEFCAQEGVRLASVSALGAADHVTIGLYDVGARQYHRHTFDEPMEITSLLGSVSTKDGETYLIDATFHRSMTDRDFFMRTYDEAPADYAK